MCDPLTLTGIALSGASAVAGTIGASQVASARNDALAAERIRQQGLDREAAALNAQSQDRYQGFEGQQQQKAQQLGDYFAQQQANAVQANTQATAQQNAPASSSNIVVREENRQRRGARQFTDQQGEALGNLRSFGDLLGGIGRMQARDANQIGQIGSFKKGSSGVLAHELEEANQAGSLWRTIGDIAGLAGTAVTGRGLQGSFARAAGAAPLNILPAAVSGAGGSAASGSLANMFRLY